MTIAFLNMGSREMILGLVIFLLVFIAIGHYGRNTQLGYTGSVLLAIIATPIVAFLFIWYMRNRTQLPDSNNRA